MDNQQIHSAHFGVQLKPNLLINNSKKPYIWCDLHLGQAVSSIW
jgi:hypothetical protein